MCINHRSADIAVAEEFLNCADVIPVHEWMGCKRMAKCMRGCRAPAWHRLCSGRFAKSLQPFSDAVSLQYTDPSWTASVSRIPLATESNLRSQKQWKGARSKSTVVITRLTGEACGFPFEENKEYLVYVVTEPKDIQTGICTGTKNITDAEQEIEQLDKLLKLR